MRPFRRAGLIARVELRRSWRSMRESTRGILILVGLFLFVPVYGLALGGGAFFLGREVVAGGGLPTAVFRSALAGVLFLVALTVLQRAVKKTGEPPAAAGLLTTTDYRTVLAGLLAAEFARIVGVLGVVGLGVAAGFGLGVRSVVAGVAVFALLGVLAALGLLSGYLGGLLVRYALGRSAFLARHRGAIGITVSLGVPAVYVAANAVPAVQRALFHAAAASPLAWYADLAFLAVPGVGAEPLDAAVAGATLVVGLPALFVAVDRTAERVWYMDPVEVDHEFDPGERTLSNRLLAGSVPRQVTVVAEKSWRRARRAPFTVQFAVFPFFFLLFEIQTVVFEGRIPARLPVLAGLATATSAGAAFALNPLGGEGDVLPMVLTSRVSGRQFVAGLCLAGAGPGLVGGLALVAGLGLAAGLAPSWLVLALATTVVATVAAPAIATGWGVVFPKFETSDVQNREVVVPSGWAFGFYLGTLGLALAPALVVQLPLARSVVPDLLGIGRAAFGGVGLVATAVLAALLGGVSVSYAARHVGTYRL